MLLVRTLWIRYFFVDEPNNVYLDLELKAMASHSLQPCSCDNLASLGHLRYDLNLTTVLAVPCIVTTAMLLRSLATKTGGSSIPFDGKRALL